jgi:flagellar hook protein FlgE
MSFYTALTGLNGSQADISASSNNIANVGTTGFKRSRAEFGDIFATSPCKTHLRRLVPAQSLKV